MANHAQSWPIMPNVAKSGIMHVIGHNKIKILPTCKLSKATNYAPTDIIFHDK
jgi:hypothetical protein